MKFTFKTEKPTGRYRSFEATMYLIKFKKKRCGFMFEQYSDPIKINLSVEKTLNIDDGNPNCKWMNVSFKKEFKNIDDAKKWLNENIELIMKKFTLYFID